MTIFVSIAAYRDPELTPTVRSCLATARRPEDLHIAICWQHGPEETLDSLMQDHHFEIIDVDSRDSQGVCWARAELMKLWRGEDFYLQIDSHHRFVQDWDVKLLEQFYLSESLNPIITTYCQGYSPKSTATLSCHATRMVLDRFTVDGIPLYRAIGIENIEQKQSLPERARFVSAHFLFTQGNFVEQVSYDPRPYFHGEEISLAVRAYTWGYDFFHPSEVILWHQYSREERPKHWSDHSYGSGNATPWYEHDRRSRALVTELLTNPSVGRFGCGSKRTLAEYEAFSGIDFRRQLVQEYTFAGRVPPNPAESPWTPSFQKWIAKIHVERNRLLTNAFADANAWSVTAYDAAGTELHHFELQRDVVSEILADPSPLVVVQFTITCIQEPMSWGAQALNSEGGILSQITGQLKAAKFSENL